MARPNPQNMVQIDAAPALAKLAADRAVSRKGRIALLNSIATARGSHVIAYVTNSRQNVSAMIGHDAIRIFRELMGVAGPKRKLDLLLITRGGHTLTPLRLMSLLREYATELNVLVPYMAHSAGTLIALGADNIVMGAMGELGPVDPSVTNPFNPTVDPADAAGGKLPTPRPRIPISVEDVTSYLSLASDRAKLDPAGMAAAFSALTETVSPLALGNILRHHTLIRHLVRRLLLMHMNPETDKPAVDSLVETLTEKLYAHDYLITRDEAATLGLKATKPDAQVETAMWDVYKLYEQHLGIGIEPNFPQLLGSERHKYVCFDTAVIEDSTACHACCIRGIAERKSPDDFGFNADFAGWELV